MPCSSFSSFSSSSVFLRTGRPDRWLYESLCGPGRNESQEMSGHLPRPSNPGPRPDGACGPGHPPERGAAPAVLQTQAAGQAPAALEGVLPEPRAAAAAPALVGPAPQRPGLRHPLVQGGRAQAPKLLQMARIRAAPIRGHTLEQLSGEAHRGGPVGARGGPPGRETLRSQIRTRAQPQKSGLSDSPHPGSPWELTARFSPGLPNRCSAGEGPACSPRGGWGPGPATAPGAPAACAAAARPPTAARAASSWTAPAWPGRPTAGAGSWAPAARGQRPPPAAAGAASAGAPAAAPGPEQRGEGQRPGPGPGRANTGAGRRSRARTCLRRNSSSSSCRRFCSSCCCCCRRFSSRRLRSSSSRFALSSTSLRSWNWHSQRAQTADPGAPPGLPCLSPTPATRGPQPQKTHSLCVAAGVVLELDPESKS